MLLTRFDRDVIDFAVNWAVYYGVVSRDREQPTAPVRADTRSALRSADSFRFRFVCPMQSHIEIELRQRKFRMLGRHVIHVDFR